MAAAARILLCGVVAALALTLAPAALAGGGSYVFDGGTSRQRVEVRAALEASAFDWGLVPGTVTIHLRAGVDSYATPGHVWLDANLLSAGRFAWAVVQEEYAHQVDLLRFDDGLRAALAPRLGARAWFADGPGLAHAELGCERFAATLVWAYWPSADNAYRPTSARDESAALAPAAFRALMADLLGAPRAPTAKRAASTARTRK